MQLIHYLQKRIRQFRRSHLDPSSLQFRLTIEIAALSILGLSSVAIWTSWKMQQILIATHTQNVEYIASRFPRDVQLYSEMLPVEAGLQKTINNVSVPGLLIWVKNPDGNLLAQSADLNSVFTAKAELMSLVEMPLKPQVYKVSDRYLVLYEGSIVIKGSLLGKVYMAQDVTADQHELITAMRSLTLVCIVSTLVMMIAIAFRIRRSLRPLHEMSQVAGVISAEDLGEAKLQLRHAPTEVKDLAQTFNLMLSRLSASWEQQRQFASNISHELRTPLTVVSGYLQSLLRRSTNLNDYQREALATASSEADRTIQLLQDLLDLARADSGYVQFNLELLTLNNLIMEIVEMSEKFSNRSILVNAERSVQAIADRSRLKQILINLIDNAVKYSDADQPIVVTLNQLDRHALIHVQDQGVGIPLSDQSRIFERFYRVDESRARFPLRGTAEQPTGGHGLGLAIVKTLVEGMNGSVSIRSKLGEGSTFTIALPQS